jgi:hypothetical protein
VSPALSAPEGERLPIRSDVDAATSAELSYASGAALDGSGNLYIADKFNQCVRMVTG